MFCYCPRFLYSRACQPYLESAFSQPYFPVIPSPSAESTGFKKYANLQQKEKISEFLEYSQFYDSKLQESRGNISPHSMASNEAQSPSNRWHSAQQQQQLQQQIQQQQ